MSPKLISLPRKGYLHYFAIKIATANENMDMVEMFLKSPNVLCRYVDNLFFSVS